MDLDATIRRICGKAEDLNYTIPAPVRAEFSRFCGKCPQDTNFLVELGPGDDGNFGVLTCLEEGCWCDFQLGALPNVDGGGAREGMGSLGVYETHIATHASHKNARNIRVTPKAAPPPPAPRKVAAPVHRAPVADKKPNFLDMLDEDRKPNGRAMAELDPQRPLKRVGSGHEGMMDKKPRLEAIANAQRDADAERLANADLVRQRNVANEQRAALERAATITAARQRAEALYAGRAQAPLPAAQAHLQANGLAGFGGAGRNPYNSDDDGSDNDHMPILPAGFDEDGLPIARGNEELNNFLKAAADGQDFEGNVTVDAAVAELGLVDQQSKLPGMKATLMPHQFIGVSWMHKQELSKLYGGILADEMGLGKTIQIIGLMCQNLSQDKKERCTLVVAPLALLEQWKDEIESKCRTNHFKCLIYHGSTKPKSIKDLYKYDVILTTYSTLALEWPDDESALKAANKKRKKAGEEESDEFKNKQQGLLFQMSWYRVVLDEAQFIRNRATRVSRAVTHLDALFRWCLTGTPITNSLADLYPLMRFCQIKPWYAWTDYNAHISRIEKKRPEIAGRRAQAILKTCLLRRKKDSTLDGMPLVVLPPKVVVVRELDFSFEEREVYTMVETRSQQKFNKYLKAGTVLKNYAHVLAMLLRLRQVCAHPALISAGYDALAVGGDDSGAGEVDRATKVAGLPFVEKTRRDLLNKIIVRVEAERANPDAVLEDEECPICLEPPGEGAGGSVITKCGHIYCGTCMTDVLAKDAVEHDEGDAAAIKYKPDERACPHCRQPISKASVFSLAAFEPTEEQIAKATGLAEEKDDPEDDDDVPAPRAAKQNNTRVIVDSDDEAEATEARKSPEMSSKKAGKQKEKIEKKEKKIKEKVENWADAQEPSTKMRWLLAELNRIENEAPDDKFIVLCSFTTMLDIVDDYLRLNNIRLTRFQGDMTRKERDKSIKVFTTSAKVKVMLMSLKCGGVGLNLVRANRVVNLDLAWSHSVEAQAFDRAHRIGQTKSVFVDRLTIKDTVDQRIAEMQERKKGLADASLGEGNGAKIGKMSVNDLALLFGIRV